MLVLVECFLEDPGGVDEGGVEHRFAQHDLLEQGPLPADDLGLVAVGGLEACGDDPHEVVVERIRAECGAEIARDPGQEAEELTRAREVEHRGGDRYDQSGGRQERVQG
jgi:hypothetical protein